MFSVLKLVFAFWVLMAISCSDEKEFSKEKPIFTGEPIVGDAFDSFPRKPEPKPSLQVVDDFNSSTLIEEGFVVNGRPFSSDFNSSEAIASVVNELPPLEDGSEFKPLPFRDLTNFEYEVSWEDDGIEFDFSSYAQRVPSRLREKSGTKVAVEGFMIPTVVDENNKVTEFLLLPDQMSCCFGQSPEANGWVVVRAVNGVEVMMDRIIRATGTLVVEERWDEEFFVGLYHMDCKAITGPAL